MPGKLEIVFLIFLHYFTRVSNRSIKSSKVNYSERGQLSHLKSTILVAGQLKKGKKSEIAGKNLKDEENQKLKKISNNDSRQRKKTCPVYLDFAM